jgi:hypothetical protein
MSWIYMEENRDRVREALCAMPEPSLAHSILMW